jgi:hypothetical protein
VGKLLELGQIKGLRDHAASLPSAGFRAR